MNHRRSYQLWRVLAIALCVGMWSMVSVSQAFAKHTRTIYVPKQVRTIQEAVDMAEPGDRIFVFPGRYNERVVISTPDILLRGKKAIIDGTAMGGDGIGIHVMGPMGDPVTKVRVEGFTVEGFERGIVLERVLASRVRYNRVRNNTDKNPADGLFNMADGIVLSNAHFNTVSRNITNDNGHNGIFLIDGSTGNLVRKNKSFDNGGQTGEAIAGCGIQLSNGANNSNEIELNEIFRNAWGILLGPGGDATRNLVRKNMSTQNRRAGLAVLGPARGNFIQENNSTMNATMQLPPSFQFMIFEDGDIDNIWRDNMGLANF